MENIINLIKDALPMLGALGGAFIGGYFTKKSQHDLFNKEIARDREIEIRKEERETLEIYNEVLKIDGENLLVTYIGGSFVEFDIHIYQTKIRPIIYLKFHLIHKDVADVIRALDYKIASCNFYEEINADEQSYLVKHYNELIDSMQRHVANYREMKKR